MHSDFQFGAWRVQPQLNSIASDHKTIRLEPKMMGVLVCLAQHSGEVVSKEQLVQEVWRDTFVTDDVLIRCISELRKAFGDNAGRPTIIETIPKRGYRLLPPLTVVSHRSQLQDLGTVDSIAVLPFENADPDPQMDYLSEGVPETIINSLSRLQNLRVVPRTTTFQYKRKSLDPVQVGRELRARLVLTGHVSRRGDRLLVGAELIDTAQESQLWGQTYDRKIDEILAIEEEIAGRVSNYLKVQLTGAEIRQVTRRSTESREAYHLFLKALHFAWKYTPEGFGKGLDFCRQAIEADPSYSDAYGALSFLYSLLGTFGVVPALEAFPRAKAAVLKALEIDDNLSDAHAVLGFIHLVHDWNSSVPKRKFVGPLSLVHTGPEVITHTVTCGSPEASTKQHYRRQSVLSTSTHCRCPRTIILVLFSISQGSTTPQSRNCTRRASWIHHSSWRTMSWRSFTLERDYLGRQ
jgi:TolB-like protein